MNEPWEYEVCDAAWFGITAGAFGIILYVFYILAHLLASLIGFDELRQFTLQLMP